MKTEFLKTGFLVSMLCTVLLLSGCALFSAGGDAAHITLGSSLKIDNTDENRVLLSNTDALAADGLYYASWGLGEKSPFEDSDGKTVEMYDARLHLLLGEYDSSEEAQSSMNAWLDSGRTEYEVLSDGEFICGGQTYTRLTYRFRAENSPYTNGVSVFGVSGSSALCIELTCRGTFTGDPEEALTDFLNCCTYLTD